MNLFSLVKTLPTGQTVTHHTAFVFRHLADKHYVEVWSFPNLQDAQQGAWPTTKTEVLLHEGEFVEGVREQVVEILAATPAWAGAVRIPV